MRIPNVNSDFEGIKVACVGDSLTYGTTLLNRRVESYPSRLAKLLGKDFDVLNLGFSGHALSKKSEKCLLNTPVIELLESYAPDYVLLLIGTNDARLKNFSTDDEFAANYKLLVSTIMNLPSSPKLIAMTCPMVYAENDPRSADFSTEILARLVQVQRAILNLQKISYVDLYNITQGKTTLYSDDKLHFNAKGAKFLAHKMYTIIQDCENKKNTEN